MSGGTEYRAGLRGGAATLEPAGRRYHVHGALVIYCLVALLLSIGAFNSNNNLLFWLFSLSLAMILVSGLISGAMLMGVRVEREPSAGLAVGAPAVLRYRVTNRNRWVPAFALTITEDPVAGTEPPADTPLGALARPPVAFVACAPARQTIIAEAPVGGGRRGVISLRRVVVTSEFPFGIVRKSIRFDQPATILVRPAAGPAALDDRARHTGPLSHDPRTDGPNPGGDHFFALREYRPGDSPRMISWRASARLSNAGTGGAELLVRQTTAALPRHATFLLDLRAPRDDDAYEQAIAVAAGTAVAARARGVQLAISVLLPGDSRPRLLAEARRGRWHLSRVLNDLALLPGFSPLEPGPEAARAAGRSRFGGSR